MSDLLPLNLIEGGTVRIEARLLDSAGIPVAPSTVRLLLLPPGATESYQHPVSVEGDVVVAVLALTMPGMWRYRFETTVEPYAVEESYINVARRQVPLLSNPGGTDPTIRTNWRIGELPATDFITPTDLLAISRVDGVTETSHRITVAQLRDMAVNLITQAPTGFFFESEGARINRMNDRLFIGDATANDGSTLGGGSGADWFSAGTGVSAGVGWVHYAASVALTVPTGKVGFAAASRASDVPAGYGSTQTSIPFVGVAVMDRTGTGPPYWTSYGAYLEARIEAVSANVGTVIGLEIDAINFGDNETPSTPWRRQTTGGATALWLASGGDPGNHGRAIKPAQLALGIVNNGETFMSGIVFANNAIEGTDGSSGFGAAVNLATRHILGWYGPGGTGDGERVSYITSTNTVPGHSLQFQDGGTLLVTPDGEMAFSVSNVANSVNGITVRPAVLGQPPELQTFGDDTDVPLKLSPQGAGGVEVYASVLSFKSDAGNLLGYIQATATDTANLSALVFGDGGPFFYGKGAVIAGFGFVEDAVAYLQISNAPLAGAPGLTVLGTGDIDMLLDPAGSAGTLRLAIPTATGATVGAADPLPGDPAAYFVVKDAAGTIRKIPAWNA